MAYGTVNADSITTSSGAILGAGNASAMKNRIINGAMVINQRGFSGAASDAYTLDRWSVYENTSGSITVGQSSTAPAGFNNSLLVTITGTASSLGTNIGLIRQYVEGYNMADLNWGSANAKTVTLSFWVQSSVTGTFTGALQNANGDYAYGFSYTISSANTWEQKTITITGATSGTWSITNGRGIELDFSLGSTTGLTANTWQANGTGGNYYYAATGQTNLFATNGATWYITGVQLEVGSSATGFEYRQYGTELALCQRYYAKLTSNGNTYVGFGSGYMANTNALNAYIKYPVTMRTYPTIAYSNLIVIGGGTSGTVSALGVYAGADSALLTPNTSTSPFTLYQGGCLTGDSSGNGYLTLTAEL